MTKIMYPELAGRQGLVRLTRIHNQLLTAIMEADARKARYQSYSFNATISQSDEIIKWARQQDD